MINWIIKLLGGITPERFMDELAKTYDFERKKTKIECLQNECNRLQYLYSESKRGRMINKIHNELVNVTNELLRAEND